MFVIPSSFIWDFKTGDNINYNLRVLALLYTQYESEIPQNRRLLCKPIIISLASITEALLHDFHVRCTQTARKRIANLSVDVIAYMRGKRIDEFEKYITSARKHDLFNDEGGLYDDLDRLRKIRNRIHIQNAKRELEPNEWSVFTPTRKADAEKCLERVIKTLAEKYPRPNHIKGHVEEFRLPWVERLPEL